MKNVILPSAVAAILLSGCSATFPLIGDTSEDVSNLEYLRNLRVKKDVRAAFGEPHSANEAQDSAVFSVWYYAANPESNVLGNTTYRSPVFRRTHRGGDPRYDAPSLADFPDDIVVQGEMIWQFKGDSVAGWCTHNLDFSQRDNHDRLARRGFIVDATLMAIGTIFSLVE